MSSNSLWRILQTAPIVSALRGRLADPRARAARSRPSAAVVASAMSALQVAQLVLADLDLVPVLEAVGLDPAPVDVGAVERPEVVDVEAVAPADKERVVSRHRDVIEEDAGVRAAPDADPVLADREALPRPPPAGADDQRRAGLLDHLVDVDRLHLAGLVDPVGHRRGIVPAFGPAQVGAALLAVVRALRVDEPALGTVDGHGLGVSRPRPRARTVSCPPGSRLAGARRRPRSASPRARASGAAG